MTFMPEYEPVPWYKRNWLRWLSYRFFLLRRKLFGWKTTLPAIKGNHPNLRINEIVSVQPMTAPIEGVFLYEYKRPEMGSGGTEEKNE